MRKLEVRELSLRDWTTFYTMHLIRSLREGADYDAHYTYLLSMYEHYCRLSIHTAGTKIRLFGIVYEDNLWPVMEVPDVFSNKMVLTHHYDLRCYDLHMAYLDGLMPFMRTFKQEDRVIHFPIVRKEAVDFDDFLRHRMSIKLMPHFFGTKSKAVTWVPCEEMPSFRRHEIVSLSMGHEVDYVQRFGPEIWLTPGSWIQEFNLGFDYSYAIDQGTNEVVAAMLRIPGRTHDNADAICRSTDEKYKPYSLVLAAQAAMIRDSVYSERNIPLNLGLNMIDDMPYKNAIPHKNEPAFNLPLLSKGMEAQDIQDLLRKTEEEYW